MMDIQSGVSSLSLFVVTLRRYDSTLIVQQQGWQKLRT